MTTTTGPSTRTYKVDKQHSEANFQVRHLVTRVRGRFPDLEGTIEYNEASPEASTVQFSINTTSIDTGVTDRDQHLRSADFFDVENYPTITFRSRKITGRGGDTYDVTGDLMVHGVTKEVVLPVSYMGKTRDPWGNDRVGFEVETTLNRKDFGLSWNAVLETGGFMVGDEVKVNIDIQAVGQ